MVYYEKGSFINCTGILFTRTSDKMPKGKKGFQKGQAPWIKGKTKENNEIVSRMSENMKGKNNSHYGKKGKRRIYRVGYIYIYKPEHPNCTKQGYIAEHRLVMEKKLKRYLTKKELVHHINGIREDNRIKNLVCLTSSKHHKGHNKEFIRDKKGRYIKKKKIKAGYVLIYKPDHKYSQTKKGWIFEHRAVVEDFLKRRLKFGECIHHISKNKKNNKIENLMVFKSYKEHSSFHNKVKQFGFTNPVLRQIKNRWKKIK